MAWNREQQRTTRRPQNLVCLRLVETVTRNLQKLFLGTRRACTRHPIAKILDPQMIVLRFFREPREPKALYSSLDARLLDAFAGETSLANFRQNVRSHQAERGHTCMRLRDPILD